MWIGIAINLIFLGFVAKYMLDIFLVVWCNWKYGVPYVPSNDKLVKETIKGLKLEKGSRVLELGSGDGRVAIEFAKQYAVDVTGYEKNAWLLFVSNLRNKLTWWKKGKVRFVDGDLFQVHFKGVDVVYMYLLIWMMEKLRPRLEKELPKGARIVSFDYPLKSKKFVTEAMIGKGKQKMVVYRKI